jgi:peptidoglycan/LPS O-acetylase OafA/YrhL
MEPVADFGWSGVDLFFVLSGFLITRQLLSRMTMGEFYIRRALRILPAYWLALLLYFAVPGFRERPEIAPLWKFLTFTQNLGLVPQTQGAFSHAWSLCIEEHFYLLLCPLLVRRHPQSDPRRFLALLGFALVGQALLRAALWTPEIGADHSRFLTWIYYPTATHLDGLIVGAGLAVLEQERILAKVSARTALLGAILFMSLGALVTAEQESLGSAVFGFTFVSVGYGFLVTAALRRETFFGGPLATALAWLAYPAYLVHKPILLAVARITPSPSLNVAMAFTLALAAAAVVHVVVERPSLRLRDCLVRRYRARNEASVEVSRLT